MLTIYDFWPEALLGLILPLVPQFVGWYNLEVGILDGHVRSLIYHERQCLDAADLAYCEYLLRA
jgi:hypothetical protein